MSSASVRETSRNGRRRCRPVLPAAGNQNAWLAALGVALTAIYGFGVIGRPLRCRWRLGPDSLLALAVFGVGIAGLFFVRGA